ncbi:MAG: PfkB family carbohydrate kinase [Erythrobacter sp.]
MKNRGSIDVVGTGFTVLDRLYTDGDLAFENLGGSCGNVLMSLAMLHRQVFPVLSLGGDEVGQRLVDDLRSAGAHTDYVYCHKDRRSPVLRQELDTTNGHHSFSFTCKETLEDFPEYISVSPSEMESASNAIEECSVFYADRLSSTILDAMKRAYNRGAFVYFEPSDVEHELFEEALSATTVLKYSSDRLGPELDDMVAVSEVIAVVTHGRGGLEVRQGSFKALSEATPATTVADTCGSGDMVSIGIIDWFLSEWEGRQTRELDLTALMTGVVAGQRLAAENCAFAGARGVFQNRNAAYVRSVLGVGRSED